MSKTSNPKVVVLGAGFGGLGAVHKLKNAAVDITWIDKNDYHQFQPLLYQLATNLLDPTAVAYPVRDVMHRQHNLTFHKTPVTSVDLENRQVELEGMAPLSYDYLILGLGAKVNFFGTPGAAENSFPMYTLEDAIRLQKHILRVFEAVDKNTDLFGEGALNFVVVGGGATGVETAGALAELCKAVFADDYPNIPVDQARVILVEGGPVLLAPFKEKLQAYAKTALEGHGVEVRVDKMVAEVGPKSVRFKSGEEIATHTLVWAGGLQANPLVKSLGVELGHGGRVVVKPDLTLDGRPEVFVVGDIAQIKDSDAEQSLPQLGSVALQSGEHAGENIARLVEGNEGTPFEYHDKGTMATIGRGAAVAQLPHGHTLTGEIAWLAWAGVHLALLTGSENRASAMVDWTWGLFRRERLKRIDVGD